MDSSRAGRRFLTVSLLVTAGVSVLFGAFALSDMLFGTALWPNNVEYGPQLPFFGWTIYQIKTDGEQVQQWEWIAISCLVTCIWLMVAAAYTNPEGILTIAALFLMLIGFAFGFGGKYKQWSKAKA